MSACPGQKRKAEWQAGGASCGDGVQRAVGGTLALDTEVACGQDGGLCFAGGISLETVRQVLKKRTQAVEEESVAHTGNERKFVARMGMWSCTKKSAMRSVQWSAEMRHPSR